MRSRDDVMHAASLAAGEAFNAGVEAALRVVFANETLRGAGIDGSIDERFAECLRYLRWKIWGKDAHGYTAKPKRPLAWSKWYTINRRGSRTRTPTPPTGAP